MTAATGPRFPGTMDSSPRQFPIKTGATIKQGWLVGRYPQGSPFAGQLDQIGADPDLQPLGYARFSVSQTAVPATAQECYADPGIIPLFATSVDETWEGQPVYGVDNQTVQLTDGGGKFPLIGVGWWAESTTVIHCKIGPSGIAEARATIAAGAVADFSNAGKARGIMTNLGGVATYANGVLTGPANTAFPTQDGITANLNDTFVALKELPNLPAGANAGPWILTNLGSVSSSWTAERPSWWESGSALPTDGTIWVGTEGVAFPGVRVVVGAAPGGTVDTTDPAFVLYDFGPRAFTARVVMSAVPAYTGSGTWMLTATANGALAAQDGVTPAAGDRLWIQEGSTNLTGALDAGLFVLLSAGSGGTPAVFIRAPEWRHNQAIPGNIVSIGGEGTGTAPIFAGTQWKSFAAKGQLVGVNAPVCWPEVVLLPVTLVSGTITAVTTVPIRAVAKTAISVNSQPTVAPNTTSRNWRASAVTAGVTGSSSLVVVAESAPGTTNASDVGTYNVEICNW